MLGCHGGKLRSQTAVCYTVRFDLQLKCKLVNLGRGENVQEKREHK